MDSLDSISHLDYSSRKFDSLLNMSTDIGRIWFVFGKHPKTGLVDIADSENSSLFIGLDPELAEEMCQKHNEEVWRMETYYRKSAPQR